MNKIDNIKVLLLEDKVVIEIGRSGLSKIIKYLLEGNKPGGDEWSERNQAEVDKPKKEVAGEVPWADEEGNVTAEKPTEGDDVPWEGADDGEPEAESEPDTAGEEETVDIFAEGPNGIGGVLQDADKGRKKIEEIRKWLKDKGYSYKNFCRYLNQIEYLAGWKLKNPPIGLNKSNEPSLFYLATRYYTYWKSAADKEAYYYEKFLHKQLEDMGVKIEMIKEKFDGVEIDPHDLPKGIEVSV